MYSSRKVIKRGKGANFQNYLSVDKSPHRLRADEVWKFFSGRQMLDKDSPIIASNNADSLKGSEAGDSSGNSGFALDLKNDLLTETDVLKGDKKGQNSIDSLDGTDVTGSTDAEGGELVRGVEGLNSDPDSDTSSEGSGSVGQVNSDSALSSEAELKAKEIIESAREEAERILNEARDEAKRIEERAREKGFQTGVEEGRDQGRLEARAEGEKEYKIRFEDFRKETERVFRQIDKLKRDNLKQYLNELKDVAVNVAEKVIKVSLRSSGEVIKRMILNEAEKMKKAVWLKIYIDKTDYEMLVKADPNIAHELSNVSGSIKFVVMEKDDSGNLILETPEEIVDMGVQTQMDNLRERLSQVEV